MKELITTLLLTIATLSSSFAHVGERELPLIGIEKSLSVDPEKCIDKINARDVSSGSSQCHYYKNIKDKNEIYVNSTEFKQIRKKLSNGNTCAMYARIHQEPLEKYPLVVTVSTNFRFKTLKDLQSCFRAFKEELQEVVKVKVVRIDSL